MNKQIKQLEQYLRSSLRDKECKSSFSAHTTTKDFEYGTPLSYSSKIDPVRLDDRFYMQNKTDGHNEWDPSSVSCSSVGNFVDLSTPMEREPYVRKYVEVNYIEGSDDKKWSSRDFPWTKKLEVCGRSGNLIHLLMNGLIQLMFYLLWKGVNLVGGNPTKVYMTIFKA